jgi:hypothetical protein
MKPVRSGRECKIHGLVKADQTLTQMAKVLGTIQQTSAVQGEGKAKGG